MQYSRPAVKASASARYWGNGETIWLVEDDTGDGNKIFAYDLTSGSNYGDRVSAKGFDTLASARLTPVTPSACGPTA